MLITNIPKILYWLLFLIAIHSHSSIGWAGTTIEKNTNSKSNAIATSGQVSTVVSTTPLKSSTSDKALQESIVPGVIIIKLKQGSSELADWIGNDRKTTLSSLRTYTGDGELKPYLTASTLLAINKRYQELTAEITPVGLESNPVTSLRRIGIIRVSSAVDTRRLVRKLMDLPFVEYAEPMPKHTLLFTPNDSNFRSQSYVRRVRAHDAWDSVTTSETAIVAIIDTGLDFDHIDLQNNVFINNGETGNDTQGKDRRTNGIDDDNNGFADDWRGWDFAGTDGSGTKPDNNPSPGNPHGTHVAGIAGMQVNNLHGGVGICNKIRILPVKIGADATFSTSTTNGYEAIAYAASMKASVINCSWGASAYAQAEQEVITTAISLGSVVVAACGNNGNEQAFYPSAYKGVLSVAATSSVDQKATFSNYHTSVGISAPGDNIYSSMPGSQYGFMNGTSMASPVVAGAVAMVRLKYPKLNPEEVRAMIMATADNIDTISGNYGRDWQYKLGAGRVNVLRAVTSPNSYLATVISYTTKDSDGDGYFDAGNTIELTPLIRNILSPLTNARVTFSLTEPSSYVRLSNTSITLGAMQSLTTLRTPSSLSLALSDDIPMDYMISIKVDVLNEDKVISTYFISLPIRPTYRTFSDNNITVTVNSSGNFGFNDFPDNSQGDGFTYKGSSNLLFESGVMIGWKKDGRRGLSNVTRGSTSSQDMSFRPVSPIATKASSLLSKTEAITVFEDNGDADQANVIVTQQFLQDNTPDNTDYVISTYTITNRNNKDIDSMYIALYSDWDIGASGKNNISKYDANRQFYYVYRTNDTSLPYTGMKLLTNQQLNIFMMDNDGNTSENPGVYDGYTNDEKWQTMTSGIGRQVSNATDVSSVIGAGPFKVKRGDSVKVAFSIFAGMNYNQISRTAEKSMERARDILGGLAQSEPIPEDVELIVCGNPIIDFPLQMIVKLPKPSEISIDIWDNLGNKVAEVLKNEIKLQGIHSVTLASSEVLRGLNLSQGCYYARMRTAFGEVAAPFIVVR